MSLRVGVQMDPVSILLIERWCLYVSAYVSEREMERESVPACAGVCVSVAVGKAGSFQPYPLKTSGKGG